MKTEEMKTLASSRGAKHTYSVEAQGDVTFFFPPSLWGASISSHELENRIVMVRTEGREACFIVRVSPRIIDTAKRNVGFHITDGLNCWFVEVRYNRHGEYLTHEAQHVAKKPHELGIVRTQELIRPEGTSREHQLSLRDYGPTVVIEGSAGLILQKVTNGGVEITSRCGYPFATLTGPPAGCVSRTIRISDAAGRSWGLTLRFTPLYEGYDASV